MSVLYLLRKLAEEEGSPMFARFGERKAEMVEAFLKEAEEDVAMGDEKEVFRKYRMLSNVRSPVEDLGERFYREEAEFLGGKKDAIVDVADLPAVLEGKYPYLFLWQGDITTLRVDAIMNAGNSGFLGCFNACHNCIDNIIYTWAGNRMREHMRDYMVSTGQSGVETAHVHLSPGFCLPAKHVLHTVGPIAHMFERNKEELSRELGLCYWNCLDVAEKAGLESVAFCCLSTGVFGFPNEPAANIAVETTIRFFEERKPQNVKKVVFNVFLDKDLFIYQDVFARLAEDGKEEEVKTESEDELDGDDMEISEDQNMSIVM